MASLFNAQLQAAKLVGAQLQGASLGGAQLQGASLFGAGLQGASLNEAQLQGASLYGAELQGASLVAVFAWRTDARNAVWEDTRVDNPVTGPKYECEGAGAIHILGIHVQAAQAVCDWSPESFNNLKRMITEQVPEGVRRDTAMESIKQSLDPDPTKAPEGEYEVTVWEAQASASPATEIYEKHLGRIWQETGCAAVGAPYVLRGLLRNLSRIDPQVPALATFEAQSPQWPALAKAFLDEEHCPGARGLSEAEKATLKEIRGRSPPPASKQ